MKLLDFLGTIRESQIGEQSDSTRISETLHDPDLRDVRWAVDKHAHRATMTHQHMMGNPDNILVWVNIKDLMQAATPEEQLDLYDPTGGRNSIGSRVGNAKSFWGAGNHMDPSRISIDDTGGVHFDDGRHRLAAAFQLGRRQAPVLMSRDDFQRLERSGIRFKDPNPKLTEAKSEHMEKKNPYTGKITRFVAMINPTSMDISRMINKFIFCRGLETSGGLYVWSAGDATHDDVKDYLEKNGYQFEERPYRYVFGPNREDLSREGYFGYSQDGDGFTVVYGNPDALQSPNIQRILRTKPEIREARSAPLYHFTDLDAADAIVRADALTVQGRRLAKDRQPYISLTRDPNHLLSDSGRHEVVFVLNQEALSHRIPMEPYYGDSQYYMKNHSREAEERVYRDIAPLHVYLLKIFISEAVTNDIDSDDYDEHDLQFAISHIQEYADHWGIPVETRGATQVRNAKGKVTRTINDRQRWYRG